jgi:hypothetical protein
MPDAAIPADVLFFFMALPFFADSTPRAYRLKAGNADLPISTRCGTFPTTAVLDAVRNLRNHTINRLDLRICQPHKEGHQHA